MLCSRATFNLLAKSPSDESRTTLYCFVMISTIDPRQMILQSVVTQPLRSDKILPARIAILYGAIASVTFSPCSRSTSLRRQNTERLNGK